MNFEGPQFQHPVQVTAVAIVSVLREAMRAFTTLRARLGVFQGLSILSSESPIKSRTSVWVLPFVLAYRYFVTVLPGLVALIQRAPR